MGLYPRDPLYPPSFSEDGRTSTVNALPAHAEEPLLIRQSAMFNIEMAALPQCFSDRRCIEALPPKGATAEAPASPHQCRGATAGGAVRASLADAGRLRGAGGGGSGPGRAPGGPPQT